MVFAGGERMRIAICDDDVDFAEKLKCLVEQEFLKLHTEPDVLTYHDGGAFFSEHPVCDAVFLDIDMPGASGFDIAKESGILGEALIIFVSCHDELVYSSLRFRPFRFIRKSHLKSELPESIDALNRVVYKRNAAKKYRFLAKTGEVFLDLHDIEYIEIYGHWLHVRVAGGGHIECYGSLSELEKQLEPFGFLRTHKSYLVNCRYIYSIEKRQVILDDKTEILLSRYKADEIKTKFRNYIRSEM